MTTVDPVVLSGVPSIIEPVLEAFLEGLDDALGEDLIEVHLYGAVALGDYVSDASDLDVIVVSDGEYDEDRLQLLRANHQLIRDRLVVPRLETIYLGPGVLENEPDEQAEVPWFVVGELGTAVTFDLNPSTWLTLLDHPLAVRGEPRTRDNTWYDDEVIRDWNRKQLETYWRDHARRASKRGLIRYNLLSDRGVEWAVLGPLRHLYTVATGRVTSKLDAARYGLEISEPKWHPLIKDTMRIRRGEFPPSDWIYKRKRRRRRRETVDFLNHLLDDHLT